MLVQGIVILRGQVILKETEETPEGSPQKEIQSSWTTGDPEKLLFAGLQLDLLNLSFPLCRVPCGKLVLMRHSGIWENLVTKLKSTL